jgi:hypothetical protein
MKERILTTCSYRVIQMDEHTSIHSAEWGPMACVVKGQSVLRNIKNATTKIW